MIQKVNAPRVGKTALAPFKPPAPDQTDPDGLPDWGSWRDGKHWKIEIVQQVCAPSSCASWGVSLTVCKAYSRSNVW